MLPPDGADLLHPRPGRAVAAGREGHGADLEMQQHAAGILAAVGGVRRHVAMEAPQAGVVGDHQQVDALAGPQRDRVHLLGLGERPAVLVGDEEGRAVEVHGVELRAGVDQAQADRVAQRRVEHAGLRERAAVDGEEIGLRRLARLARHAGRGVATVPLAEDQHVVVGHRWIGPPRQHDEGAGHAARHVLVGVDVAMVEVRPRGPRDVLVHVGLAGPDRRHPRRHAIGPRGSHRGHCRHRRHAVLRRRAGTRRRVERMRHAVHALRHEETVRVEAVRRRGLVGEADAHPVAFASEQCRAGDLGIERPDLVERAVGQPQLPVADHEVVLPDVAAGLTARRERARQLAHVDDRGAGDDRRRQGRVGRSRRAGGSGRGSGSARARGSGRTGRSSRGNGSGRAGASSASDDRPTGGWSRICGSHSGRVGCGGRGNRGGHAKDGERAEQGRDGRRRPCAAAATPAGRHLAPAHGNASAALITIAEWMPEKPLLSLTRWPRRLARPRLAT